MIGMSEFEVRYLMLQLSEEVGALVYSIIGAQFAIYMAIYWLRRGQDETDPMVRHGCMAVYSLFVGTVAARTMQVFGDMDYQVTRLIALETGEKVALEMPSAGDESIFLYTTMFTVIYALLWLSTAYLLYIHNFNKATQSAPETTSS